MDWVINNWDVISNAFFTIASLSTIIALFLAPMFYLGNRIDAIGNRLDAMGNRLDAKIDEKIDRMDAKIEENRRETHNLITSIQQEMKDFHGRLERQDAEFKARLCSIEEGRK